MLLSHALKTVSECCSVFDISFPDDYLTDGNNQLWFLFSCSLRASSLCTHVYRFRVVAVCASGPPVAFPSADTYQAHEEVHGPGDTVPLIMEKQMNSDDSEPHKPRTARWSSRFLFHLHLAHPFSVHAHPLPSHLRPVVSVYT